jgi:Amt family ammonium transporter
MINGLKRQGCRFALDDFGSGLSSFNYLKSLPVDYLKIDGAFVKDMHKNAIDRAMVESINQIGHLMGIQTVAEFVTSDDVLAECSKLGIDYVQGYHISRPRKLEYPLSGAVSQ